MHCIRFAGALASLVVVAGAGCAPVENPDEGGSDGAGLAEPDDPQPTGTAHPWAPGGEDGPMGVATSVPREGVVLWLTQAAFGAAEPLVATVANGTRSAIYVEDLRTGCSIAVLERRTSSGWVPLESCGSERQQAVLEIPPQHARTIRIDPAGLAAEGQPMTGGVYRLVVPWGTSGTAGDTGLRAVSAPFEVR